jgi:hypothetical protein
MDRKWYERVGEEGIEEGGMVSYKNEGRFQGVE